MGRLSGKLGVVGEFLEMRHCRAAPCGRRGGGKPPPYNGVVLIKMVCFCNILTGDRKGRPYKKLEGPV